MDENEVMRPASLILLLLATVLIIYGSVADAWIGLMILHGGSPWQLLLHPIAVLTWATGIAILSSTDLWPAVRVAIPYTKHWRRSAPRGTDVAERVTREWNARASIVMLISLVLFPGFGPAGWMVACGITAIPFMVRGQRPALVMETTTEVVTIQHDDSADPLHNLAIEPLVDVVNGTHTERKRAAIRMLGHRFDHEAVSLLRGLLSDANVDVRSEASVTLFRFEELLTRGINEAAAAIQEAPTAERYAALAESYCRAVAIGSLDETSARHYLTQACYAYRQAIALAPACIDFWVSLARTFRDRGEMNEAVSALDEALGRAPTHATAYALRMEIAFLQRRWDLLVPATNAAAECSRTDPLLRWWAGDPPGTVLARGFASPGSEVAIVDTSDARAMKGEKYERTR